VTTALYLFDFRGDLGIDVTGLREGAAVGMGSGGVAGIVPGGRYRATVTLVAPVGGDAAPADLAARSDAAPRDLAMAPADVAGARDLAMTAPLDLAGPKPADLAGPKPSTDLATPRDLTVVSPADLGLGVRLVYLLGPPRAGDLSNGGGPLPQTIDDECSAKSGTNRKFAALLGFANLNGGGPSGPINRLKFVDKNRPIVLLPNGRLIAANVTTFFSDVHAGAIDTDAQGNAANQNDGVWTNFRSDGTAVNTDCAGWRSAGGGSGIEGEPTSNALNWAFHGTAVCSVLNRIYCLEVDP
jgi:hypothetical protein